MNDGDKLVAWLREAADELEKAHGILDAYGVRRTLNDDGVECTLAARIALAFDHYREALELIANDVDEGEMRKWARQALDGEPLTDIGR